MPKRSETSQRRSEYGFTITRTSISDLFNSDKDCQTTILQPITSSSTSSSALSFPPSAGDLWSPRWWRYDKWRCWTFIIFRWRAGTNSALEDVEKFAASLLSAPQSGYSRDVISPFVNEWYVKPSQAGILLCSSCLAILVFIYAVDFQFPTHLDSFSAHLDSIPFCRYSAVFRVVSRGISNVRLMQTIRVCP